MFGGLAWLFPSKYFRECIKCEKIRYMHVDAHEIFWVVILILLLASSGCSSNCLFFTYLVLIIVIYRLVDIFQSWVSQFILMKDWIPADINRSLVLVFMGYFEIIVSYAIFYYIGQDNICKSFSSVWQSFYYSVSTATMIGSDIWKPMKLWGYATFITQIMFAVLFLTVVVQNIVGRKDKK
jgi:hypothetical protein